MEKLRIIAEADDYSISNLKVYSSDVYMPKDDPVLFSNNSITTVNDNVSTCIEKVGGAGRVTSLKTDVFSVRRSTGSRIGEPFLKEVKKRGRPGDDCCMILPPELGGSSTISNLIPMDRDLNFFGSYHCLKSITTLMTKWVNSDNKSRSVFARLQIQFFYSRRYPLRPCSFKLALQLYSSFETPNEIYELLRALIAKSYNSNSNSIDTNGAYENYIKEKEKEGEKERRKEKEKTPEEGVAEFIVDCLPIIGPLATMGRAVEEDSGLMFAVGLGELVWDCCSFGIRSAWRAGGKVGGAMVLKSYGKRMLKKVPMEAARRVIPPQWFSTMLSAQNSYVICKLIFQRLR